MVDGHALKEGGTQFVARGFSRFIYGLKNKNGEMLPCYPRGNGKVERWRRSVKSECIRPGAPLSLGDAIRLVADYVRRYNEVKLHGAIGDVRPADQLAGSEPAIFAARDQKLEAARERRQKARVVSWPAQ